MLLSLETTHHPATDLGFLLHKHPARLNSKVLPFGEAHVFYPVASDERCRCTLLVEVDPIALARGHHDTPAFALQPYVNDRPYTANSLLCVALSRVFGSALNGHCKERPEVALTAIPLIARLPAVTCRGGEGVVRELFEPLGYSVQATLLDAEDGRTFDLRLEACCTLSALLTHLYVLIPVLDDQKHYWVDDAEVQKLLDKGKGWLQAHPKRELITQRYLERRSSLVRRALNALRDNDLADGTETDALEVAEPSANGALAEPSSPNLNDVRLAAVLAELEKADVRSVVDLGCGEGRLLRRLVDLPKLERIIGVDVSPLALERAERRLRRQLDDPRLRLVQGSLCYRDERIEGFDAIALVEVVEHLEPFRLESLQQVVFGHARPRLVVLTTPNREHNVLYDGLQGERLRHRDHRFEWTRDEFQTWASACAKAFGYVVRFESVGAVDAVHGAPTQMGVFTR